MDEIELNYYQLLGVNPDATRDEIKHSYHKLLLQHHPDKAEVSDSPRPSGEPPLNLVNLDHFCEIEKAWKVLQDDKERKCYDAELKARQVQNIGPLHEDEMALNKMSLNRETQCYEHHCRCGGLYALEEEEACEYKNSSITLYCDSCSLSISVNM